MITNIQALKKKRDDAKSAMKLILNKDDQSVFIIHYSCESFDFKPQGTNPRIFAVAVRNLSGERRQVFSIHAEAAKEKLADQEIKDQLEKLEVKFLEQLEKFFELNGAAIWLHWNMNSDRFGFDALCNRYRSLADKELKVPPAAQRSNFAAHLKALYGSSYACAPHLDNVMRMNNLSDTRYLHGGLEAVAADNLKYKELHDSSEAKVNVITELVKYQRENKLKTHAKFGDRYGGDLRALVDDIMASFTMKLLGFVSLLWTAGNVAVAIWNALHPVKP